MPNDLGETMQMRLDAKNGNQLSVLGFGCMRFPQTLGKIDYNATEKLILDAIDQGINYFDTAYMYFGSEDVLGSILEAHNLRDKVYIASKLPHGKCKKPEDMEKLFQTSLSRLKTNYIDYYLLHNITRFSQWERMVELGVIDWIAQKKAEGAIKQIGFSFHGPYPDFEKLIEAYDWDIVQIQYNYINEKYQAGRDGLNLAASKNIPVVIMEPLLGGRLADSLPPDAAKVFKAADKDASAASWGLRWLMEQPEVTVVLSGMNAPEQLADNIAVANATAIDSLTNEERQIIADAKAMFEKDFKVPCTGCNYCMPCPKGLNIPAAFAAYNESFAINWFTGFFHYFLNTGMPNPELHFVSDCSECGACEKKCPQEIEIRSELKNVRKRLQPPGCKKAAGAASAIMRKVM